jgi:acylphosphatase
MNTYRFKITGKVQGVSYRKSIQQMAAMGQLQGYIKNQKDGSVEAVVFLYDDQLEDFISLLKNGSSLSKVDDISYKVIEEEMIYDGFMIK